MKITKIREILDLNRFQVDAKAISSKITYVFKEGDDVLNFNLTEALTSQENSDLDDLVLNFSDSDPNLKTPKIYDITKTSSKGKHFHAINYKTVDLTQSLIPKRTIVQGEVRQVLWYQSLNAQLEPDNLILKVDINYTRDATGFATQRATTRTWINKDESENNEVKITTKYYFVNPADMIAEGLKRRKLLVNNLQIPVMTFMSQVLQPQGYTQEAVVFLGRAFLDDYESDFSKFVDNSSTITTPGDPNIGRKSIVVQLEDDTPDGRNADYNFWLDLAPASLGGLTTIRQYLINEFSI